MFHQGSGEVEGMALQGTAGDEEPTGGRSHRGQTSFSQYSGDPQDLLAMNAELSRMAKELRLEMMKMWSFRGEERGRLGGPAER